MMLKSLQNHCEWQQHQLAQLKPFINGRQEYTLTLNVSRSLALELLLHISDIMSILPCNSGVNLAYLLTL